MTEKQPSPEEIAANINIFSDDEQLKEENKQPDKLSLQRIIDMIGKNEFLYICNQEKGLPHLMADWDQKKCVTLYDESGKPLAGGLDEYVANKKRFEMDLRNEKGELILRFSFRNKRVGSYLSAFDETGKNLLCRVQKHPEITGRRVVVTNASKNLIFTLKAGHKSSQFTIWFPSDLDDKIGKISYKWKAEELPENVSKNIPRPDVLALKWPPGDSIEALTNARKAMLVAAMFHINFLWPKNVPRT